MARSFSFVSACLRIDAGCSSNQEPHVWPQTPPGRTGTRWIVRDGNGVEIGAGEPGNPTSAWRRALVTLQDRSQEGR